MAIAAGERGVYFYQNMQNAQMPAKQASEANVVKGHSKQAGYKPQPMVIMGRQSFTHPAFFEKNNNWRESLYSGNQAQIVVMTISPQTNPTNDVPNEVHDFDQFILIQSGKAEVYLDDQALKDVPAGSWLLIPAYTPHYIKNASQTAPLKILSIYSKWDTEHPTMTFKTLNDEKKYDESMK
ncbi:MAG: cupin domain-containing protein [Waddliaceae bacterium]